jgi:sugar phosphate isomerase/epimerase
MTFKHSITLSSFRGIIEPAERILETITGQGFDAVEMFGEPSLMDSKKLAESIRSFNISVSGVTGMWGKMGRDAWKRRLLSLDSDIVTYSVGYVKDIIVMCQELDGKEINLCLFADDESELFDKNHGFVPEKHKQDALKKSIPILIDLSKCAKDYGVQLLLEPLNRYNTPFCTTAMDAIWIARQLNQDNFGVLLDTYHMNIEEDSFADAITQCEGLLRHTHFAENNRKMPGRGHIDFRTIVASLHKIGYDGFISFEPTLKNANYESEMWNGLEFIKKVEKSSIPSQI